ncbi:hypothetical protein [Alkaliphilus sp. B6464]|uniref:hypothetical protein n=1 Tax=Alkaliphilus sp. B6464 TaxID=2731219 RepID=UPI001BA8E074|nr:hypothetical protein [Alkaliphilus sp. B6464]QUH21924.1 hypothetical protein HYG84_18485 [Alkaliphilus sp. B6464]
MGSCTNYSRLERYIEKHGVNDKSKYEEILLGKKVIELLQVHVFHHIKSDVKLDDGLCYEVHFRWAIQEEDESGEELPDLADSISMIEYYEKNIIDKKITEIEIGYDRDDMVYCYAFVGEPTEKHYLEIPIIQVDDIDSDEDTLSN